MDDNRRKINKIVSRHQIICRAVLCLAGFAVAVAAQAFQGETTSTLVKPSTPSLISPTYLEKGSNDPLSLLKEQSWQISGLNTRFTTTPGNSQLDFSGGFFYSNNIAPNQLSNSSVSKSSLNFTASPTSQPDSFINNIISGNKPDRAFFQHVEYRNGGLNLGGTYSSIDKNFMGLSELAQQVNPSDAAMLGLGLNQTKLSFDYTEKGLKLSSSRLTVENMLTGNAENGLTRSILNNSIAFALSPRQNVEYSIAKTTENWDTSVTNNARKESQLQTLRWAGSFGQASQFSFGQTQATTRTGSTLTEQVRLNELQLKMAEWNNLPINGIYSSKVDGVTGETNNILNLNANAALSSNLQLSGTVINNSIDKEGALKKENDLLDLQLAANLAHNLHFKSVYHNTEITGQGNVLTRDHLLTWAPSSRWNASTHLVITNPSLADDAMMLEHMVTGQIGTQKQPEEIHAYARKDVITTTAEQDRVGVTYTRALEGGDSPARLLIHEGNFSRSDPNIQQSENLMAVQLLNFHPIEQTTASIGYYDGPLLGAGFLTYRTWGKKNPGNLAIWGSTDFAPYREFGGEASHRLTKSTTLLLKQMHGELAGIGQHEMAEYGIEQQIGTVSFRGSNLYTQTPGADGNPLNRYTLLTKFTAPSATPLPEWAVNSMRFTVFQDSATWGFGVLPVWVSPSVPISGLTFEKRDTPDAAGQPVEQYTFQAAHMLSKNLCVQLSNEVNPLKADNSVPENGQRRYILVAYALRPSIQSFWRLTGEELKDQQLNQQTSSMGIIGQLSSSSRLQFQIDAIKRATNGNSISGSAFQLEYERTVNKDNTLSFKLRMNPEEFSTPQTRMQTEIIYRLVF